MQKVLYLLIAIVTINIVIAQPTKTVVMDENAELREVGNFKNIEISSTIRAYISQGEIGLAVSCTNEKNNKNIITKVENNTLKIFVDNGGLNFGSKKERYKVYISVKDIENITISGASYLNLVDNFTANNVTFDISGASILKGAIFSENVKADISGASVVKLSGNIKNAVIDISGASSLSAADLIIGICKIHASGASSAKINVENELDVHSSGASNIRYKGKALVVKVRSTGASSIKKED